MRDLLKSKTTGILNPALPNENDRAFLHGLMGEKEGERDYQQQISGANRAISDLQNAFRGSKFESGLKPSVTIRSASTMIKHAADAKPDATDGIARVAVLNSAQKPDTEQHSDNKKSPSGLQNSDYSDKGLWHIQGTNNSGNQVKLSESNAMLEEHISKNYAGKKTVTIAIRRPVENSREVAKIKDGKLDNGHAFIRIDDGQGNVEYVGFTPKDGGDLAGMVIGTSIDGKYIDDSKTDWNVAKVYVLTDAQYANAASYIKQVKGATDKIDYNVEKNNCVDFALDVLAYAGQSAGEMMPVKEHQWTLPENIEEQMAEYSALPSKLPPELAALVAKTMGRYYGYTPSDAAQDLKNASGGVLLNYDGSNGLVPYNA